MNGTFLQKLQEAAPDPVPAPVIDKEETPKETKAPTKSGGLVQKLASGAQKAVNLAKNIEKIGTGQWDPSEFLQSILTKELDKGTANLHNFGKRNYDNIIFGDDIVLKLNQYGAAVADDDSKTGAAQLENYNFVNVIDGLLLEKRNRAELEQKARELDIKFEKGIRLDALEKKINAVLKDAGSGQGDLDLGDSSGPTKETKERREKAFKKQQKEKSQIKPVGDQKSAALRVAGLLKRALKQMPIKIDFSSPQTIRSHPTVQYIIKNPKNFLKLVQEEYPNIKFTYDGGKGFSRVEKTEDAETTFDDALVIASKGRPFVKSLGQAKAERIVRGLVDIYPGRKIVFEEPEKKTEPKPEEPKEDPKEEPKGDAPTSLSNKTEFKLKAPQNFGNQGVQFTLSPSDSNIQQLLKKKGIKYLTYLVSKPNSLGVRDTNAGTIYAYDEDNKPISALETKANFKYSNEIPGYIVGQDIEGQLGPQADKGEGLYPKIMLY